MTRKLANVPSGSLCSAGKCLATSSGTNGARMPLRFQTMRCAASDELTTSTAMDAAGIFLADALEHALGAGALDPHLDAGIFRLERLGDPLRQRQVDRGVVDDLAFFLGGLDQLRRDRLGGRRLRPDLGEAKTVQRRARPIPSGRRVSRIFGSLMVVFSLLASRSVVRLVGVSDRSYRSARGSAPAADAATPTSPARCSRPPT